MGERRGSVLIVVIGLLLVMMLTGIAFFTFASQEHSSAEFYADSAKVFSVTPNVDPLFDWALEQLIIGPHDNNKQSVLWPGQNSLVPNMLGLFAANPNDFTQPTVPTDRQPYNGGRGIHIIVGSNGQPILDQDFDGGTPGNDNNNALFAINWSPTTGSTMGFGFTSRAQFFSNTSAPWLPARDVGYTYPDINNVYLAHIGNLSIGAAGSPNAAGITTNYLPSFHRPQYLRDPTTGVPFTDWQTNQSGSFAGHDTTARVMRPHPAHLWVDQNGNTNTAIFGSAVKRYLQTASVVAGSNPAHTVQPFVFTTGPSPNGHNGDQGIWSNSFGAGAVLGYDYDNDGDGIREGIWLDLNFPPSILSDGRISVPLFSYTVLDADSLVNLNYSGNLSGFTSLSHPFTGGVLAAMGAGNNTPVHRSNQGLTPREINPGWTMTADPTNTNFLSPANLGTSPSLAMQQYRGFFNISIPANYVPDRVEMSNTDVLFLLWGRPNYTVTTPSPPNENFVLNNLTIGLWGEPQALLNGVNTGVALNFPRPGNPNIDDNGDQYAGVTDGGDMGIYANGLTAQLFPYAMPFGQPLDYYGAGQWLTLGANGLIPSLIGVNTGVLGYISPANYLQYTGYQTQFNLASGFGPSAFYNTMADVFAGTPSYTYQMLMGGNWLSQNTYMLATIPGVIDEPAEVIADPRYLQSSDQYFSPDETAALQLAQTDYLSATMQSRVRALASFNFSLNQQAAAIRRRHTTVSNDRKNHAWAFNNIRAWEYGITPTGGTQPNINDWDGSGASLGASQFPPRVLTTAVAGMAPAMANSGNASNSFTAEPIRLEVAAAIGARAHNGQYIYNAAGSVVSNFPTAFNTPPYNSSTFNANMTPWQQQLRLNVNRLTVAHDDSSALGASNGVHFRELTPHPTQTQWNQIGNGSTTISTTANSSGFFTADSQNFSSNPALQEYWARRDRQMLARDIYVMLYLFGGGQDVDPSNGNAPLNYAATSNAISSSGPPVLRKLYNDWQLAEMAQFAVNYVDALDRDDTITMFEYDKDLSDGWNLDDNPMTATDGGNNRGLVFGVEAQQLAFNEALVILSRRVPIYGTPLFKDHPATNFDDSLSDRTFTYLELYNVSPYTVSLASQNWQIVLLDPASALAGTGNTALNPQQTTTVPASATGVAVSALTLADSNTTLGPGQNYTIGSRSYIAGKDDVSGSPPPSTFMVDPNNNTTPAYQQIAPTAGTNLNLDLVKQSAGNQFFLTDGQYNNLQANGQLSAAGQFCDLTINASTPGDARTGSFQLGVTVPYVTTFVLRRRLNMNRPAPQVGPSYNPNDEADNPFVEVDRISYQLFDPTGNTTTDPATGQIPLPSYQPLAGTFFNLRDPSDPGNSGMAATYDIQPKLMRLESRERRQPLDGFEGNYYVSPTSATPVSVNSSVVPPTWPLPATFATTFQTSRLSYYSNQNAQTFTPNTIGQVNRFVGSQSVPSYAPASFTLWQPHFDRDFAAVMELLSLPLYGPGTLTQSLAPKDTTNNNRTLNNAVPENPLPPSAGSNYLPLIAQAKFFRPQHPTNYGQFVPPNPPPNPQYDNRWHRIFELLEVPTRENLQVENYLQSNFPWLAPSGVQRAPARMNLNCLRNAENLFALLDDPSAFSLSTAGYMADGAYMDFHESANRNWWQQLLNARDGNDPQIANLLGAPAYAAGSPASRPFKSFSSIDTTTNPYNYVAASALAPLGSPLQTSVDDTLLRTLPLDAGTGNLENRRLFESRAAADLASNGGTNSVDYYTRQRLLAKIAGNTTNRSNVFIVWISVGFFEGYQPDSVNHPGVVQVGAQMTDQPVRRGFFIVDRTLLEDAWSPTLGTYDFRKFVQYRKTIQ